MTTPRKKTNSSKPRKRKVSQAKPKPGTALPEEDPLLQAAQSHFQKILALYLTFADKKPVMLLDMQQQRVSALPYEGFKAELSQRSQALLTWQYAEALKGKKIVVFVRDNEQKRLVSYLISR